MSSKLYALHRISPKIENGC